MSKLEDTSSKQGSKSKQTQSRKSKIIPIETTDSDDDSSEGMFADDIPKDHMCNNCAKNEKVIASLTQKLEKYESKDTNDKLSKIYTNGLKFISVLDGKKVKISKTNCKCWWDNHPFDGIPCFLPERYDNKTSTYHVRGCFCSFNCALAYNLHFLRDLDIHRRKSLVYNLYREMYNLGFDDPIDIKEAPSNPQELLKDYGGQMSIETFRRSFIMLNREFIVYYPPIKPFTPIVEERNIKDNTELGENDYVLKRSKPLNRRRTVMTSMRMK
jgi:hypothetical protein